VVRGVQNWKRQRQQAKNQRGVGRDFVAKEKLTLRKRKDGKVQTLEKGEKTKPEK